LGETGPKGNSMKTAYIVCVVGELLFGILFEARDFTSVLWQRAVITGLAGAELAATIVIARSIALKARQR
jgi:hypothetical protein